MTFSLLLFLLLICDWIILSLLFSVPTGGIGLEARIGLPFAAITGSLHDGTMAISWGGLFFDLLILAGLTWLIGRRGEAPAAGKGAGATGPLERRYLYTGLLAIWGLVSFAFATRVITADGERRAGLPMAAVIDYTGPRMETLVHEVNWVGFLVDMLCVVAVAEGLRWWSTKMKMPRPRSAR